MPQIQKAIKTKEAQKTHIQMSGVFLQNHKNQKTEIFAFCVITFEPIKI